MDNTLIPKQQHTRSQSFSHRYSLRHLPCASRQATPLPHPPCACMQCECGAPSARSIPIPAGVTSCSGCPSPLAGEKSPLAQISPREVRAPLALARAEDADLRIHRARALPLAVVADYLPAHGHLLDRCEAREVGARLGPLRLLDVTLLAQRRRPLHRPLAAPRRRVAKRHRQRLLRHRRWRAARAVVRAPTGRHRGACA
mmetsp:Transcript_82042/g.199108  ORF Transcript_82042/g.199108 Transcript_82042/m.199108 type:complete len:200 (+) Transcript_82042:130-729(+)